MRVVTPAASSGKGNDARIVERLGLSSFLKLVFWFLISCNRYPLTKRAS